MTLLAGLAVCVVCAVGAVVAAFGVLAVALPGRPQPWRLHLMRRGAWFTGSAAAAVYALGLSGVMMSEAEYGDGADSVPAPACRDGFDEATRQGLSHHRSSYLPLRFDCVRYDGSVYSSDPSYTWLNWTSASLALCGALLVVGAGFLSEFRARRAAG
ncbi:hypothetical protein ACF061_05520 [Streptomyces sp. NPDC015220]|uniref:hypothetical protein n=1 Tax=Streptomyces sp. NPDC015220 TaxID=3364947 RepID=UPI0036F832C2